MKSQATIGPDLTSSMIIVAGRLKKRISLRLPKARSTDIPKPRTNVAAIRMRLTKKPTKKELSDIGQLKQEMVRVKTDMDDMKNNIQTILKKVESFE